MLARLATVILFVLPAIMAIPTYGSSASESCTTGSVMCCNDATKADPSDQQGILGTLLGLGLGGLNIPITVNCVPATGIGAGSQSCTGQVACCEDKVNALVSLECIPINASG